MRALSHIFSTMRGSVGGITYMTGQNQQIIGRIRTAPCQPNTNGQSFIRSIFSGMAQKWSLIGPTLRADWNLYGPSVIIPGPQGPHALNGRQAFIAGTAKAQFARSKLLVPFTVLYTSPVAPGMYALSSVAPGVRLNPGTRVAVTVTNLGGEAVAIIVEVSRPFGLTRDRYKGPWDTSKTVVQVVATGAVGLIEIIGLVLNATYHVRVSGVVSTTGHAVTAVTYLKLFATAVP